MEKELKILMLEDLQDDVGLIERTLLKEGMSFSVKRVDTQKEFSECLTEFQPDVILSDHALPQFNSLEALKICDLKEGMSFSVKRVDTQDEFTECLQYFQPDVILSDHALPQFNSLEALKICRKQAVNAPFILVTGTVSEEFAVSCLKQGADDYVLKSNMVRLPSAIHNALKQRHHEAKRKKAERTLRKQNEELVKINKELDSFVYSVSHNLRAPLMSVLGLINLVQLENKNS